MRTKIRTFFDESTDELVRTVIPDEHDGELIPHLAQPGEVMVDIPLTVYESMTIGNLHPHKEQVEAWYKHRKNSGVR